MKNLLFNIVEHHKTIYIIHQDFNSYIATEIKYFEASNDCYIEIDEPNLLFNTHGKIYTKRYNDCKSSIVYISYNKMYNYFCKDLN